MSPTQEPHGQLYPVISDSHIDPWPRITGINEEPLLQAIQFRLRQVANIFRMSDHHVAAALMWK
jgi:hypothetical protein